MKTTSLYILLIALLPIWVMGVTLTERADPGLNNAYPQLGEPIPTERPSGVPEPVHPKVDVEPSNPFAIQRNPHVQTPSADMLPKLEDAPGGAFEMKTTVIEVPGNCRVSGGSQYPGICYVSDTWAARYFQNRYLRGRCPKEQPCYGRTPKRCVIKMSVNNLNDEYTIHETRCMVPEEEYRQLKDL
ncbi:hypothetical protein BDV25DRAFT_138970 [Aspergillus avenaceus]|uniref:Secreted protein n=1 Tax=Aspergillus avenaceus TaxID=36643 RepID=A0A5N6TY89_ASPAV|nr:hypothetical protein BDV25DRAFT_138970 [Aspergillus avenaceus]